MKHFYSFFVEGTHELYVDLDGVLTNFELAVEQIGRGTVDELLKNGQPDLWRVVNQAGEEFWSRMNWMPDGKMLWSYLKQFNPTILSSPSRSNASKTGKLKWCKRELGNVHVILESQKEKYASPNSILIDDTIKKIDKWKNAGGIGILHNNTKQTINQLKQILGEI